MKSNATDNAAIQERIVELKALLQDVYDECCGWRHCGCQHGSNLCLELKDCIFHRIEKYLEIGN